MTRPTEPAFCALADRLLEAPLAVRRSQFDAMAAGTDALIAKAKTWGSTAHRESKHHLCATELDGRAALFVTTIIDAHASMNEAPSAATLGAAKDWIATKIANEATALESLLPRPREAFGDKWPVDALTEDARRETNSRFATLDAEWHRLQRARVERSLRWISRTWQICRTALGLT
jgi:hypothetical protein